MACRAAIGASQSPNVPAVRGRVNIGGAQVATVSHRRVRRLLGDLPDGKGATEGHHIHMIGEDSDLGAEPPGANGTDGEQAAVPALPSGAGAAPAREAAVPWPPEEMPEGFVPI